MPEDPEEEKFLEDGLADQTLKPTPVSAWKKQDYEPVVEDEGFIAELPSGNVVRMTRTMDMAVLLKTGQIPNPLAGIVQTMIDQRTTDFPASMADDMAALTQLLDLMNETAVRVILEPPFDMPEKRKKNETGEQYQARLEVWKPDFTDEGKKQHKLHSETDECTCERKISAWDLTPEDRQYIFAVAQGAAADLARFREEQERVMASLQTRKPVPKPTKRTSRAKSKK